MMTRYNGVSFGNERQAGDKNRRYDEVLMKVFVR